MNLTVSKDVEAKDLNEFIDYWSKQYYLYTNVSDSLYYYCINSIKDKTDLKNAISLIGSWKTNSISLYSTTNKFAYKCSCGAKYYYTNMWKNGTSSAYSVWLQLESDFAKHISMLSNPQLLISELELKKYQGSRSNNTNFGFIYSITYLHFLKPEIYPIFDKFVFLSINYLYDENKNIPYKTNKKINYFNDYLINYVEYFNKIKDITKKPSRCIDKALWAFGHYIVNSKKLIKPVCCSL